MRGTGAVGRWARPRRNPGGPSDRARAIEDGLIRPGEVATYTPLASRPRPALS